MQYYQSKYFTVILWAGLFTYRCFITGPGNVISASECEICLPVGWWGWGFLLHSIDNIIEPGNVNIYKQIGKLSIKDSMSGVEPWATDILF